MAHKYFRKMQEVAMTLAKEDKEEHLIKKASAASIPTEEKIEESKKVIRQPKIISLSESKGEE